MMWTDPPAGCTARAGVLLLAARGPFPAGHLEKLAPLLRSEVGELVAAAWDLVDDGVLTYDAGGVFHPVTPHGTPSPPSTPLQGATRGEAAGVGDE